MCPHFHTSEPISRAFEAPFKRYQNVFRSHSKALKNVCTCHKNPQVRYSKHCSDTSQMLLQYQFRHYSTRLPQHQHQFTKHSSSLQKLLEHLSKPFKTSEMVCTLPYKSTVWLQNVSPKHHFIQNSRACQSNTFVTPFPVRCFATYLSEAQRHTICY